MRAVTCTTLVRMALVSVAMAIAGCGGGGSGGPGPVEAPTGVSALSPDSGTVTVSWNDVTKATGYNIYWSTSPGFTAATGTLEPGTTSPHTFVGLTDGTTHYFVVTALNGRRESAESPEVSAQPIAAPTNPTAAAATGEVRLDWSPVPGASQYNLYRGTSPGVTKATGTKIPATAPPHIDATAVDGQTYYYVVAAENSIGGGAESAVSPEVCGQPVAPPTPITTVPGPCEVMIDWSPSAGATEYHLYYSTSPGVTKATGTWVGPITPPFTHNGLTNGTAYYYVLTASHSVCQPTESDDSPEFSATPDVYGNLDTTLNGRGWLTDDGAAGGASTDQAYGIVLHGAGRILVAGRSVNAAGNLDGVIWGFNLDGTVDSTFGTGGRTVPYDSGGQDLLEAIALLGGSSPLAGIFAAGKAGGDMLLARFDADGNPVSPFGAGGFITFDGGFGADWADDLMVDPGRGVVVCGMVTNFAGDKDMAIWRYGPDGTPDSAWGGGTGWTRHHNAAGGNSDDLGIALLRPSTSSNYIVVGTSTSPTSMDLVLWRIQHWNGGRDGSFGASPGGGMQVDGFTGSDEWGFDVAEDAMGRIVVTGYTEGADRDMALWRYDQDGNPDTTFSPYGGHVITHNNAAGGNGFDGGWAVALDSLGRIVVAGESASPTDTDMALWRFLDTGLEDPSFGPSLNGVVVHHDAAGGASNDYGTAMVLDSCNRIYVAGHSTNTAGNLDIAVWKYR